MPTARSLDDAETLERLRMWYRLLQSRRGLVELLLPKKSTRVDKLMISRSGDQVTVLGRIETLIMGRVNNSLVAWLENPKKAKDQHTVQNQLSTIRNEEGLEFIRSWNVAAISAITLLPFVLSLVFASVWIGVYAHRGDGIQVVVTTAVGIASYTVIAGSLLIALVSSIDSQSPKESYDLATQLARLAQRQAHQPAQLHQPAHAQQLGQVPAQQPGQPHARQPAQLQAQQVGQIQAQQLGRRPAQLQQPAQVQV